VKPGVLQEPLSSNIFSNNTFYTQRQHQLNVRPQLPPSRYYNAISCRRQVQRIRFLKRILGTNQIGKNLIFKSFFNPFVSSIRCTTLNLC